MSGNHSSHLTSSGAGLETQTQTQTQALLRSAYERARRNDTFHDKVELYRFNPTKKASLIIDDDWASKYFTKNTLGRPSQLSLESQHSLDTSVNTLRHCVETHKALNDLQGSTQPSERLPTPTPEHAKVYAEAGKSISSFADSLTAERALSSIAPSGETRDRVSKELDDREEIMKQTQAEWEGVSKGYPGRQISWAENKGWEGIRRYERFFDARKEVMGLWVSPTAGSRSDHNWTDEKEFIYQVDRNASMDMSHLSLDLKPFFGLMRACSDAASPGHSLKSSLSKCLDYSEKLPTVQEDTEDRIRQVMEDRRPWVAANARARAVADGM